MGMESRGRELGMSFGVSGRRRPIEYPVLLEDIDLKGRVRRSNRAGYGNGADY